MASVSFMRQFNEPPYGLLLSDKKVVVATAERSQAKALKIQPGWKLSDVSFKGPGVHLLTFSQKIPETTTLNLQILNFVSNAQTADFNFFLSLEAKSKVIDLKLKIGRHFPGMPFPAEICVFSLTDSLTSLDDLFPIPETLLSPSVQFYISFVGKFSSSLSQKTCLSFCKAFKNLKFSFETSLEHKKQPKNAFKHKPRKNSPPSFFFGLSRDFNDRLRHSAHYSFSQLEPTVERSPTVTAPPNIILFPYSTLVRLAIFLAVFSGETLFTAENIAICILAMGVYAYASNLLSRCVYWVSPGFYECWGRNISDGLKNRMDRLKESFSFDRLVIGLTNRLSAMGGVWGSEALLFAYGFFASLFPHWSVPQEMQSERE